MSEIIPPIKPSSEQMASSFFQKKVIKFEKNGRGR